MSWPWKMQKTERLRGFRGLKQVQRTESPVGCTFDRSFVFFPGGVSAFLPECTFSSGGGVFNFFFSFACGMRSGLLNGRVGTGFLLYGFAEGGRRRTRPYAGDERPVLPPRGRAGRG